MQTKTTGAGDGPPPKRFWRALWALPVLILILPAATRAPWTVSDYLFMAGLFGAAGLLVEVAVRASANLAYRAAAALAVAAAFFTVWINAAVGVFADGANPATFGFLGVILIALVGAVLARLRAAGMARAMFAATAAQVVVSLAALAFGWSSPGALGLREVGLSLGLFTPLWLGSALLFRWAAAGARTG